MKKILNLTSRKIHSNLLDEGVYDLDKKDREQLISELYQLTPEHYTTFLSLIQKICIKYQPKAALVQAQSWIIPKIVETLKKENVQPVFIDIQKKSYKGIIKCSI